MQQAAIYGIGSISALGSDSDKIWNAYSAGNCALTRRHFSPHQHWVGALAEDEEGALSELLAQNREYRRLDRSVSMAILATRRAIQNSGWERDCKLAIQFGSSRGATETLELAHQTFLNTAKVSPACSPTTTLGNLASWVGQDLGSKGAQIENSVTCSTGLHALVNAVAWLRSGMAERFIVGASEAPLTPFGLAQMRSLGLYTESISSAYPCRPLDLNLESNSLVIGEGACALCVAPEEDSKTSHSRLALISGIGFAAEALSSPTSISVEGEAFFAAMKMALGLHTSPDQVDLVVMHAPGTSLGDKAELSAVSELFGEKLPLLYSNKWALGHTFAASGLFSIQYALAALQRSQSTFMPYAVRVSSPPRKVSKVLVNAAGFGGNAVSILLSR